MSAVRTLTASVLILLLAGGYLASQWAYFFGDPQAYAAWIYQSTFQYLSLALLAAIVGLHFVRTKEEAK